MMKLPVNLTKRIGAPVAVVPMGAGRYTVVMQRTGRRGHYQNVMTARGLGAVLAELPLREREALLAGVRYG